MIVKNVSFNLSLVAALWMVAALPVQAQSTVVDQVFSEVEKRIIRDHYGWSESSPAPENQSVPKWAVKDAGGDDEDDEQDKVGKGNKDKGKSKKDKGDKADKGKGDKDKSKGLPPGLAKRDELPPGLAKQLKEKGRLPPGIAKRDLPEDLRARLPKRPDGQEVAVVDNDVVLVNAATGIILDVLNDVVTNGAGAGGAVINPDGTLAAPSPQHQGSDDGLIGRALNSIFGSGK